MTRTILAAAVLVMTLTACGGEKPSAEECLVLNQKNAANTISETQLERLEDC